MRSAVIDCHNMATWQLERRSSVRNWQGQTRSQNSSAHFHAWPVRQLSLCCRYLTGSQIRKQNISRSHEFFFYFIGQWAWPECPRGHYRPSTQWPDYNIGKEPMRVGTINAQPELNPNYPTTKDTPICRTTLKFNRLKTHIHVCNQTVGNGREKL